MSLRFWPVKRLGNPPDRGVEFKSTWMPSKDRDVGHWKKISYWLRTERSTVIYLGEGNLQIRIFCLNDGWISEPKQAGQANGNKGDWEKEPDNALALSKQSTWPWPSRQVNLPATLSFPPSMPPIYHTQTCVHLKTVSLHFFTWETPAIIAYTSQDCYDV